MRKVVIEETYLIGLSLKNKTVNENGQSGIDCKNLWHAFENGKYAGIIPGKLSDEIYGVYHHYEGDSTKPFSYLIGCKVEKDALAPAGLEKLVIPAGIYAKIFAKGKMPDCVINAWKEIWSAGYPRNYQIDFEVYDERSKDWNNAEVDVYLSVEN